ncbi:MAG: sodium:solute symporter [Phaeodactylibacter sp.]|uniref:sodium:solute symporter n=1 Tax=Phaeodactylibacter sp. TaxID=1940289 RepID=UPI0032EE2951
MLSQLTPTIILGIIALYFIVLISVSYFTSRNAGNAEFFLAGRNSPWPLVAIGMIGATLSGVTFISIPGVVGAGGENQAFSYMQMVFGYILGYVVIAQVLLPLYYKKNLTSIYGYLEERLGLEAYKTGAAYFLLSRTIGAAFRLYLVAIVLQAFVLGPFGVPFFATVAVTILLIWVYTFKGGINTIVWTDTLQTVAMLTAVILTILFIGKAMETDISGMVAMVRSSDYSQMFFFEGGWNDPNNFFKQFISGALITIVMTGLDQDMMQKNLSCRNIGDAQKNMYVFSSVLVVAKFLFLSLGALLYIYAASIGLDTPERTDELFPMIALNHLPAAVGIFFVLGLIAAAYSSADSALTALTTSFCVDFLGFEKSEATEQEKQRTRLFVHIGFSVLLLIIIVVFNALNNKDVISQLFKAAGYTYGPILGLFTFGLITNRQVRSRLVIPVCIAAPILSYVLNANSATLFMGFQFGFLIIALNGLLTFAGLWAISEEA